MKKATPHTKTKLVQINLPDNKGKMEYSTTLTNPDTRNLAKPWYHPGYMCHLDSAYWKTANIRTDNVIFATTKRQLCMDSFQQYCNIKTLNLEQNPEGTYGPEPES